MDIDRAETTVYRGVHCLKMRMIGVGNDRSTKGYADIHLNSECQHLDIHFPCYHGTC